MFEIIIYSKKKSENNLTYSSFVFNFWFILVIVFFLSEKTALIKASENGHVEVVKTLCEHDADLNIQDEK